ncbi:hypothetical protein BCR41DRAFT_368712 [Lobosporangium transversale]|uniref:Uncharacterized protein n=1 Tax=Lobosporangium transversale TaxID=64571 RepID=A0A1Y2GXC1_9FUNG|nr:hypothetical protein BCR41DRAFT_368712 [Lobosporangium transversale]ORZ24897.1 hypothetical protein BCR41DRAFT_368712 [Lobosporangium transversale]|eukprot:XP_021883878.1 hypothetical protein BCR41DRAFT_368712 [Lobosporangium transversale]
MNYCEGPSELISDVVHKIMALEKYRHRFIPHVEDDIIYEGDEVEKDDEDDVDYNLSLSDSSSQDSAHSEKCIEDVLESPPSSPTIHDYQEINEEESMENYLEFMNARHEIDNPHLMKRWVAVQRQLELFNEYRHLLRENQQMNEGMKELNQNNECLPSLTRRKSTG